MSYNIDDLLEEIEILKGYKHMHQKINEQNKRYREAIERAVKRLNGIYAENHEVALVYVELAGVLEGESSEGN